MVAIFCTGGWDIIFSILIYVEKSVTFHIKMYLRESNMVWEIKQERNFF